MEIACKIDTNIESIRHKALHFISNSKSPNTLRAYKSDWKQFEKWCFANEMVSLPSSPQTVVFYITHLSGSYKVSSIKRKVACLSEAHRMSGMKNPVHSNIVEETLKGVSRTLGTAPSKKKAIRLSDIRQILPLLPESIIGIRDKALLLIGFAGGFRRSELVKLDISDIEFTDSGITIHIKKSKTDQEGAGYYKTIGKGRNITTCPVTTLKYWIEASGITEGKLFRSITKGGVIGNSLSTNSVSKIIKKCISLIGLNASDFAGHSLRSGFISEAKEAGIMNELIMKMTNHKTASMISEYYQGGEREIYSLSASIGF